MHIYNSILYPNGEVKKTHTHYRKSYSYKINIGIYFTPSLLACLMNPHKYRNTYRMSTRYCNQ